MFTEPAVRAEWHPEVDRWPTQEEERRVCPSCHSEEYQDAEVCISCKGWSTETDAAGMCPDCRRKFAADVDTLRRAYGLEQSQLEDAITILFGW